MSTVTRLLVNKTSIAETRIETTPALPLSAGQVRLQVERVALTSNNISYAATGDILQYWRFFPADGDWGCVPAWGFAMVTESTLPGIEVGARVWGFLPMASSLVVEPHKVRGSGFQDGAAHRRDLAAVYNDYTYCAIDPMHRDGDDDLEAVLRPLFSTGWLVDDFLSDQDFFGSRVMILSSASSKTAYTTASRLAAREGLEIVGLTAARNRDFVESLGCYDTVLGYDDIGQLDSSAASVYLDFAGNAALRRDLHAQLGQLRHSCLIGASHVDKVGGTSGLPGPKPTFLFVPDQVAKRAREWGFGGLMQRMAEDWRAFLLKATDPAHPWILVAHHQGGAAAQAAYASVLQGRGDARTGHMLSF